MDDIIDPSVEVPEWAEDRAGTQRTSGAGRTGRLQADEGPEPHAEHAFLGWPDLATATDG